LSPHAAAAAQVQQQQQQAQVACPRHICSSKYSSHPNRSNRQQQKQQRVVGWVAVMAAPLRFLAAF
jgi:hypothetical protein